MEKFYLFQFDDNNFYEMTCGTSFKDAVFEMSNYTGQNSELFYKCLKAFDSEDVEDIIKLFNHFSICRIENVYIIEKKIYG